MSGFHTVSIGRVKALPPRIPTAAERGHITHHRNMPTLDLDLALNPLPGTAEDLHKTDLGDACI